MNPVVLVAGLDERGLPIEAPVLRRPGHEVLAVASARDLLEVIATRHPALVVLGPLLPDLTLPATVKRIRSSPVTRRVSVLVLMTDAEPVDLDVKTLAAGANAVLRRPLDQPLLDTWVAKLLEVPRRVEARLPVEAQVVGSSREGDAGHFFGLTRNVSVAGMLLASPIKLSQADLDLEFELPGNPRRLRALGRVVREAPEVGWPYLGYGVEFLFLPPETQEAIVTAVLESQQEADAVGPEAGGAIHSTLRRGTWVYEIHEPIRRGTAWHAEIRRAPAEGWRPGLAGPFYVVDGGSTDEALEEARAFVRRLS